MRAQYESQLICRAMDQDGDMCFGAGPSGYLQGIDAMAQVLRTRLGAIEGEWWEGDEGALPYMTDILGAYATDENKDLIDLMIVGRIMDTVGVISVSEVTSSIDNRHYSFRCRVQTVYGETTAAVSL